MSAIICLATFNGARWLQEQIDSLVAQSDENWQLFISDDGSSDATLDLVQANIDRDARIHLLDPRKSERGVVANFEYLLSEAARGSWDFVVLCDQDDVWDSNKLMSQRQQLLDYGACCSDLMLTDANGKPTGERLLKQLNAAGQPSVGSLLAQNSVVGCTLAVRPAVLELALPFPRALKNHDWWLALCALSQGPLFCDPRTLVNYRQHDANVVGAYKPLAQLRQIPRLLGRQRAVFCSQFYAVQTLVERLKQKNKEVPLELQRYLQSMGSESLLVRLGAQSYGAFAAPHMPLRALRVATALKKIS